MCTVTTNSRIARSRVLTLVHDITRREYGVDTNLNRGWLLSFVDPELEMAYFLEVDERRNPQVCTLLSPACRSAALLPHRKGSTTASLQNLTPHRTHARPNTHTQAI